ncbi:hypothetical protein SDC9_167644 [bioreactor metagenome]|uniref:Uncharacterized protein n=1 Tax=bioreactor metagenome TaxID=1076179 RepID=A0A645G271_9ZZZZ
MSILLKIDHVRNERIFSAGHFQSEPFRNIGVNISMRFEMFENRMNRSFTFFGIDSIMVAILYGIQKFHVVFLDKRIHFRKVVIAENFKARSEFFNS